VLFVMLDSSFLRGCMPPVPSELDAILASIEAKTATQP